MFTGISVNIDRCIGQYRPMPTEWDGTSVSIGIGIGRYYKKIWAFAKP
jgi:hypothetical protein